MLWKRMTLAATAATWFGAAPAQDVNPAPPVLLPNAPTADAPADASRSETVPADAQAGPELVLPAPVPAQAAPDESEVPSEGPAVQETAPETAPAEQVVRRRKPVEPAVRPQETRFRPVEPPALAPVPDGSIDDTVRQATANLPIDEETRSRYRLRGGEWWFYTRSGKWMYFRDGAWRDFDPATYQPHAAATATAPSVPGRSVVVPLSAEVPAARPAVIFGGPTPIWAVGPPVLPPPAMDRGDWRRAVRKARRGEDGWFFGPAGELYGPW